MALNIQMAIRKNLLFIRLRGELDQASTRNFKFSVEKSTTRNIRTPTQYYS